MPASRHQNRLAAESSPYLLQHASNPVDWRPWGPGAFDEARERGVPILLSVGYATCYWCHVMERECFEDPSIARKMNEGFVCVKVDREERPAVDDVYMTAVQILTGRGGWPMTVFLTPPGARGSDDPGLEPYWGGTYFPPEPRPGLPSINQVLEAMSNAYANQRDDVLDQAASLTQAIRGHLTADRAPARLGPETARQAYEALRAGFDHTNGGFHGAPKFPQAVFLEFLLDVLQSEHTEQWGGETAETAERMLRLTLDRMATGGIHDHLAGGFHRYAVDATWTVPHFEKMLYDQGQLASVYARAATAFNDPFYARVARRIGSYVIKEMQHERGGFFSAQDAEVDSREGLNYLWRREELDDVLGEPDAEFASRVLGLDGGPNFKDPHHEGEPPRNVLTFAARPEDLAEREGVSVEAFWDRLDAIGAALLDARNGREKPALDDKVIASWNGLMIAGLADTSAALGEPAFARAAARAAEFVLTEMRNGDGGLVRTRRNGKAGPAAHLEDYAFMIKGLLALHRATGETRWRDEARGLLEQAETLFAAPEGGWFDAPDTEEGLLVRLSSPADGALPSATSTMLNALTAMRGDADCDRCLSRGLAATSRAIAGNPLSTVNAARLLLKLDDAFLERAGVGKSAEAIETAPSDSPVSVYASARELEVGDDGVELSIELRIAEGFHLNAHRPGVEGLTGLSVEIDGGMGFEAVADFPPGKPYTGAAVPAGGTLFAHEGSVVFDVRVQRTGEPITGDPRLVVTYQACDDRACLQPMQATLGVDITIPDPDKAASG